MNITAKHYKSILSIIERLHEHTNESEMRTDVAEPILSLLNADYFASFCWDAQSKFYGKGIYLNMDDSNIENYCKYYQFRDPITFQLSLRKNATAVSEKTPHRDLRKTEFFNDFLLADGLYYGVNLHLHSYDENIGDFRIWRKKGRDDFDKSACTMLDLLKPHMIQAVKNIRKYERRNKVELNGSMDEQCVYLRQHYKLTGREIYVARLLLKGESDDCISQKLNIEITTVRTHIKNIFKKTKINSRNKLQMVLCKN